MKTVAFISGILFIVLGVLTPLATTLVTFLLPETFASSAMILHPAISPTPLVTAVQMIITRSNLDLVITDLDLAAQWGTKYRQPDKLSPEKCRAMLNRMIQIEIPPRSSIVKIKVFSDDKVEAATIANKFTQIYCRTVIGSRVIDPAAPNPVPARPNKRVNIMIGSFAGLIFLTIGIGFLIASRIARSASPQT
jgi:capsular polysaccharide biosynthesis protein